MSSRTRRPTSRRPRWAPASSRGGPRSCPARRRPTPTRRGRASRRRSRRPHPTSRSACCAGPASPPAPTATRPRPSRCRRRSTSSSGRWTSTVRWSPSPTTPACSCPTRPQPRSSTPPWPTGARSSSPAPARLPPTYGCARTSGAKAWTRARSSTPSPSPPRSCRGTANGSARPRPAPSCPPGSRRTSGSRSSRPACGSAAASTAPTQTRIEELVEGAVDGTYVYVERGYQRPPEAVVILLVLGVLGGVLMLGGTLTATFLALSDARPDLATLAAVGAAPRTRRRVAAAYALVIGFVGAVLGAVVGFIPGVAISRPLTSMTISGATEHRTVPRDPVAPHRHDRARAAAADRGRRRAHRPVAAAPGRPPRLTVV